MGRDRDLALRTLRVRPRYGHAASANGDYAGDHTLNVEDVSAPRRPPPVHGDAYEGEPPRSKGINSGRPDFEFMSAKAFAMADFRLDWLVKGVLVRGQPAVLGGPKKSLKTNLLVDLAISLGTGQPFLNHFAVERAARVAIISGESGPATLQETARRIAVAKQIDLAQSNVLWGFRLPQLTDVLHLTALQETIAENNVEVLILDPLYLSLLAGVSPGGPQASNLYQIGPLLMNVANACLAAGATPILAHHFKGRPNQFVEPQLDDLAFSGISEFARQWLLLSRRERYAEGTGYHPLFMTVGGSAGHSGLWNLDIDEGITDEHFQGRKWDVRVAVSNGARSTARDNAQAARKQKQLEQDGDDDEAVIRSLDGLDQTRKGVTYNAVQNESRLSDARMQRAVTRLESSRILEQITVDSPMPRGKGTKPAKGLRRVQD